MVIYQRIPIVKEKDVKRLFTLPNILTCLRMIGAALLLFFTLPSPAFYVVYTMSGLTDMIDGALARAMGQESELGSRLDSAADLLFYSVMIIKMMPFLSEQLPVWLWCLVGAALLIRLGSYSVALCKYHRFASLHTYMNKLTGLLIFPVPYLLKWQSVVIYYTVICISAVLSSSEELLIHLREPSYDGRKKMIFGGRKKKS